MNNNNILILELSNLQLRYRDILLNTQHQLISSTPAEVINEIVAFWHGHKKLVESAVTWLSYEDLELYIFTAAVDIDIEGKDHLPFLATGKAHILDDPVCRFAQTHYAVASQSKSYAAYSKEQVLGAIDSNLKIINEMRDVIYILPVSHLLDDKEYVNFVAEKVFTGMFNGIDSMNDYMSKCSDLNSIISLLNPSMIDRIILNELEDLQIDFPARYNIAKEYMTQHGFEHLSCDSEILWFALYSKILRASNIFVLCTKYQLVPYIRYDVVFYWFINICMALRQNRDLQEAANAFNLNLLELRSRIAFTLSRVFNRDIEMSCDVSEYAHLSKVFNVYKRITEQLNDSDTDVNLVKTADSVLDEFYEYLKKTNKA